MDQKLTSLTSVVERTDARLRSPEAEVRIWPTGFPILDDSIGGGFRAGALNVLAGPQGQGKSTMALQMCRNAAAAGCSAVMFSFELEAEVLLQRLISLEAGLMFGTSAPPISQIREAFDGSGGSGGLPERLLATRGADGHRRADGDREVLRPAGHPPLHHGPDRHDLDRRVRQGGVRRHRAAAR